MILEVQDSKGKHYGRVVVPVAAISQDSVKSSKFFSTFSEMSIFIKTYIYIFIAEGEPRVVAYIQRART